MERKIKASFTTTIIANLVVNQVIQVSKLELKKHFMQALSNSEKPRKIHLFYSRISSHEVKCVGLKGWLRLFPSSSASFYPKITIESALKSSKHVFSKNKILVNIWTTHVA